MNTHLIQTLLSNEKTRALIVDMLREEINKVIDTRIKEKLTMHTTYDYSSTSTKCIMMVVPWRNLMIM